LDWQFCCDKFLFFYILHWLFSKAPSSCICLTRPSSCTVPMKRSIITTAVLLTAIIWSNMAVQAEASPFSTNLAPASDRPIADSVDFSTLPPLEELLLAQASRNPDGRVPARYIPPRRGLPGRREGSGTRGKCPAEPILLAPNDHVGLTTSERPTFFWYVASPNPIEFTLVEEGSDGTDHTVLNRVVEVTEAGIVQMQLPSDTPPLKAGKSYTWTVAIYCNPQSLVGENVFMQASIQRVIPDINLAAQLRTASPEDKPAIYAAAGIWYDTLTTLANLRRMRPDDAQLKTEWADLLRTVKLPNAVLNAPLVTVPTSAPTPVGQTTNSSPVNPPVQSLPGKLSAPDARVSPRRDTGGGTR
jgi:hypothetical protein